MEKHIALLGFKVHDVITDFSGIVTSISFDISGCIQALVCPGLNKDNKIDDSRWYDTKRLEILSKKPVVAVPTFKIVPGGQELPSYESQPKKV